MMSDGDVLYQSRLTNGYFQMTFPRIVTVEDVQDVREYLKLIDRHLERSAIRLAARTPAAGSTGVAAEESRTP